MLWFLLISMTCASLLAFTQGDEKSILDSNEIDVDGSNDVGGDEQVYLGYSSNPWGPSRRLDKENNTGSGGVAGRSKRGVIHLYNMVLCATGCNPLAYKGYGCYCGFLGSGYTVDPIDRCCKMHDWCYNTANCPMYLEYFVPYTWKCYRRRPLCAIDHGSWGGVGSCAQRLCECDRQLAECLRRYPCPRSKAVCTSSPWRFLQNVFML
ncbi:phospholipase A2 [Anabrus simplex]|uniref:phospholipase A2 n=1 Tax=Anabrus simplex TaxID=316456 RepID=UPI0034DCCBCD